MPRCVPFLVLALSAVGLAIPAVTGAANPSGDPSSEESPTLLFVQDAKSGSLVPIAKHPGKYRLTLRGVHPRTLWFENRPGDFKGTVPNQQMLNIFFGKGAKGAPPNGAIDAWDPVRQQDVVMGVKLLDAKWNRKTRTLRYRVSRLLDGPKRPASKPRCEKLLRAPKHLRGRVVQRHGGRPHLDR